jgi:cytochrome c biogenesis protein CcdA/glutaredoxin
MLGRLRSTLPILLTGGLLLGLQAVASAADEAAAPQDPILETALLTARKLTNPYGRAEALMAVGEACARLGHRDMAAAALADALAAARDSDAPGYMIMGLGEAYVRAGLYDQASQVAADMAYAPHAVQLLCKAAGAQLDAGAREDALQTLAAARARASETADHEQAATAWVRIAEVCSGAGLAEPFEEAVSASLAQVRFVLQPLPTSLLLEQVAGAYIGRGALDKAAQIAQGVPTEEVRVPLLAAIAERCAAAEQAEQAASLLARAFSDASATSDPYRRAGLLIRTAEAFRAIGQLRLCQQAMAEAERSLDRMRDPLRAAAARDRLVSAYMAVGDGKAAERVIRDGYDAAAQGQQLVRLAVHQAGQRLYQAAVEAAQAATPEALTYVGEGDLRALAEAFYNVLGPNPGQNALDRVQPASLRDAVLAFYAEALADRHEYEAALRLGQAIGFAVTRDNALSLVAQKCLSAADSLERAEPASAALRLLAARLDKLKLRTRLASRMAELGLRQQALEALEALQKDVMEEKVASAKAEILGEIAIAYQKLGQRGQARTAAARSIAAALEVACASCRDQVIGELFGHLSAAEFVDLAFAAAEKMDLPYLKADNFLRMCEVGRDLSPEQKEKLLRQALASAAEVSVMEQRIRMLVRVASGYHSADLRVNEADRRRLRESLEAAPVEVERPTRPPGRQGTGPAPLNLVYFDEPGCPQCEEAKALLKELRNIFPGLVVEAYSLTGSESAAIFNEAICEGLSIPKGQRKVAPSVFSARGGLVGSEITLASLAELARNAQGAPSPIELFRKHGEQARTSLHEEFRALGLLVVVSAGLADGINPCAFTVIIFFLSYLAYMGRERREIVLAALVFTIAVFVTYFAIGVALTQLLHMAQQRLPFVHTVIYAATGLFALAAAGLSAWDGVKCLRGRTSDLALSLPDSLKSRIRLTISRRARLGLTVAATLVLGSLVAFFEFPCTGQVYVPIVVFLQRPEYRWHAMGWLLLYNGCFVLPLIAVTVAVFFGLTSERLTAFFRRHVAVAKFVMAVAFAGLAAYMLSRLT